MATSTEEAHLIFLSHSGNEKPFVTRLDRALRDAGHDPFFDKISLPMGELFPSHINYNARNCKLGVVVLSPGFLKSKWPMIELHAMHTHNPRPTILPLFFAVKPADVKPTSPIFSEWKTAWEAFEKKDPERNKSVEWEAAVKFLSNTHGIEYIQESMTEEQFITKAVWAISSIVLPLLRYDRKRDDLDEKRQTSSLKVARGGGSTVVNSIEHYNSEAGEMGSIVQNNSSVPVQLINSTSTSAVILTVPPGDMVVVGGQFVKLKNSNNGKESAVVQLVAPAKYYIRHNIGDSLVLMSNTNPLANF